MQPPHVDKRYLELAQKWLENSITPEEKKEFTNWYNENQDLELMIPAARAGNDDQYSTHLLNNIQRQIKQEKKIRNIVWLRPALVAAVFLLVAGLGVTYYLGQSTANKSMTGTTKAMDVLPGGDKATLTLGDGATLELDQLADGALTRENGFVIRKTGGELVYESLHVENQPVTYNTIRTPRGGQFRVILPDGSKVWLNSASSLTYPTVFKGEERHVKMTGEGYFEIAKVRSGNRPTSFKINVSDKETVEVLGTHFNIMAYADEKNITTTLLEGSVKVVKPGTNNSSILKPGQQSVYTDSKGFQIKTDIDPNESVSWKNGLISYKDADIQTIMRQIERWYAVEVIYKGNIPTRSFTGGIARNSKLSSVLKVLELNDVHFELHENQITILP